MRSLTAVVLGAVCLAAACTKVTDPSKNRVDTFTGTLLPAGVDPNQSFRIHTFNVPNSGEFSVKITSLAPITNIFLGTALGFAQNDGSCAPIPGYSNTLSQLNVTALSGAITPGNYCLIISDVGQLTVTETYTLIAAHP